MKQSLVQKVLIIGWDGATWAYIDPLLAKGKLPHLQNLLNSGVRAVLRSTRPPYTNIAWPSLVTGLSPVKTGVYDAALRLPGSYQTTPYNLSGHRGAPIWQWIAQFGRRAGVLNVPMTFPAAAVNGYLVTGFDSTLDSDQIAYPRQILADWAAQGHPYRILEEETALMDSQNPHQPRGNAADFTARWARLTEEQGEVSAWLWQSQPVDLMFVVFSGTDSINHRTRDMMAITAVYQAADKALGRILETLDEQTLVCLVSDHGSTPADRYISLNRALHEGGWLRYKPELAGRYWRRVPAGNIAQTVWQRLPQTARRLISRPLLRRDGRLAAAYENIDWPRTKAFVRSSMGPVYINTHGRYPQGRVSSANYETVQAALKAWFEQLTDGNGRALFQRVWRRQELYPGAPASDDAPDLLLEPADWRDHMVVGFPTDPLTRPIPAENEYGTHTPDGILALYGPGVKKGVALEPAHITDPVPTILAAWGLPIPEPVDGQVLTAAFTHLPPVKRLAADIQPPARHSLSESDEVVNRLRALGYLD
ncbi:MAG TPA: hypothetical protein EYH05_17880 [Anaerolineae bacterium]|nr:hypothetical protein [Anaerolineae bacterium]